MAVIASEGDAKFILYLKEEVFFRRVDKIAGMGKYDKVLGIFFEPRSKVAQFKSAFSPEFTCLIDHKAALNEKLKLSTFPQTVELKDGMVMRSWTGLQEGFDD